MAILRSVGRSGHPRRRGLSLGEVLLAAALGGLLLMATYRLFVTGARLYARGAARGDLQMTAAAALRRMVGEIRKSAWLTLTVRPAQRVGTDGVGAGPVAVSLGVDAETGDAFAPGSSFVVYWHDPVERVVARKMVPRLPGILRLTWLDLAQACADPDQSRVVARNVASMELHLHPADAPSPLADRFPGIEIPGPVLDIRLVLEGEAMRMTTTTEAIRETVTATVSLRNKL